MIAHHCRIAPGPSSGYPAVMKLEPPDSLPYTGDPRADALLASEPLALLIGFVLDQQVSVQKAFGGPLELRERIGHWMLWPSWPWTPVTSTRPSGHARPCTAFPATWPSAPRRSVLPSLGLAAATPEGGSFDPKFPKR